MNLLGAKLYDPATAVSKSTASLLAMTAFDTTNLRLAITVPAHGMVYFRVFGGAVTGATTVPTILLGVLNGATVIARVSPQDFPGTMNAASQSCPLYAEFLVTGLTPGAMNVDLAYAVQVVVASTNIKYGGPNNTTGANAWGGISFQAWDPQPMTANATLAVDTSGRVDVGKVAGTAQTAKDLGAQLDATVSSRMATYTQPTGFLAATFPAGTVASTTNITAGTITTATNLTNAPTAGDFTATMKTSIGTAVAASAVASVTGNIGGNVAGSVGSVTAAVTLPSIPANWITAAGINAAALNGKGDWLLSSGYTAPDNAGIAAAEASAASAATDAATAAANSTAIKTKTDSLNFTVAGKLDVNVLVVNGVAVSGNGSVATPWGPA